MNMGGRQPPTPSIPPDRQDRDREVASEQVMTSGSNLNLKGKEIKQIELIFNIVHLLLSMSHT